MGVVVLDAENGGADSIRTGNFPMGVLLHPTADRVYVANAYSSSLTVISDEVGIAERRGFGVTAGRRPMPTVLRGVLYMPVATGLRSQAAGLLDVSGRKVLDLVPGANDVRGLAPGVYFVREEPQASSYGSQAVRKVIITR
jgi:DNA-binding beta-propeller fold protein YncE